MPDYTYSDLIEWSRNLEDWQRDALRRLLTSDDLTDDDVAELADMACPELSSSDRETPTAIFATSDHIPASADELPTVRLVEIRDIQRVNALAEGPICFDSSGLTVVYGATGSGKSGVSRILKKACYSRDPGGDILPNVFNEPEIESEPAKAKIHYLLDGECKTHDWVQGGPVDPNLSTVNVFDIKCAAVQIEQANVISYTPHIVRVFPDLAEVTQRVQAELQHRKTNLGGPQIHIPSIAADGDTAVGKYLNQLSKDSKEQDLSRLTTISDSEKERIGQLDRALGPDPARFAQAEETRAKDIEKLIVLMREANDTFSDSVLSEFESAVLGRDADLKAAMVAQREFAQGSAISGIGGDVWQRLWEAARAYSETDAFQSESFPVTRDGAVCVLCQQPLSDEADHRLHSFEEFVRSDLQQRAGESKNRVLAMVESAKKINFPTSSGAAVDGIKPIPESVALGIRQMLVSAKFRRRYMRQLLHGLDNAGLPEMPPPPSLDAQLSNARQEAIRFRNAQHESGRAEMMSERAELRTRIALTPHAKAIKAEIGRLKSVHLLDNAINKCRTNWITLEGGKASKAVITNRLRSRFATNLISVGFSGTPVEIRIGSGEYGEHPYETTLMARPDVPPGNVLSEGERTCVALAGFLAELETTGNTSAIVIDDPVSSLDHQYRKRVAERLANEAKSRQVILLTHDVIFFFLLRKYSHELGTPIAEMTLERGYRKNHGVATKGPPWFAMTVNQRIKKLREDLLIARRDLNKGNLDEYRLKGERVYKELRDTWERAVEEVLLYSTVLRFGEAVQTNRLAKLTDISEDDITIITREMSRCSELAHDMAPAIDSDILGPDIVEADIAKLADWVKELRNNRSRR